MQVARSQIELQGADPTGSAGRLDVISIGRSSVDLYGQQIGSRLEDVASFAKSVGGCPSNIAIGAARLGLRSGLITRVGNEAMGRYIREQLRREGVVLDGVVVDPERLTALVLLAVESDTDFPLVFYRENCADMALCEEDIDESFVARARAVVVTGTHFSKPSPDAAQRKAMRIARAAGGAVCLDIDYRPNLWGLAGHDEGDSRFVESKRVSAHLATVLPGCDLVVGTEEEIRIAGGEPEIMEALRAIRQLTAAVIVVKRGPLGCVVFDGEIPTGIDAGIVGRGYPVEIYNVLGAGDAFMAGFLRAYLRGEDLATAASWANACGAFAVSRLLCSPESPTFDELKFFLAHGSPHRALRKDETINHIHWATTRRGNWPTLFAFAVDHRAQLEEMAGAAGASVDRIPAFKLLAVEAAARAAAGQPGFGMLLDGVYSRQALVAAARHGFWIGRPVELPGSRPLRFEDGPDLGSQLVEWPLDHCIKCLCFYHPEDPEELKEEQLESLLAAYRAARKLGRELLIEIIASKSGSLEDDTLARSMSDIYGHGIRPDWWKLEPQRSRQAWAAISKVLADNDRWCRGVLLLGLDLPQSELEAAFAATADVPAVKGFAVGRTIFAEAAQKWFRNEIEDEAAVADMAARFSRLVDAWRRAREREAA